VPLTGPFEEDKLWEKKKVLVAERGGRYCERGCGWRREALIKRTWEGGGRKEKREEK